VSSPRVSIVTGAASGIGRAVVDRLVRRGERVVALDRPSDALESLASPGVVEIVSGDVTDEASSLEAVRVAETVLGGLDAVVLNAGVPASGDLLELPIEVFDRTWEVNVRGVLLGLRACVPALRRRGGGRIVITASTSGIAADPNMWPYNSAKAAAINLARGAALDLGADGINVNVVCPGPTETGMTKGLSAIPEVHESLRRAIPLQRWGNADEVAAVIVFLASSEASFVTGAVVPVDGGITANTGQFTPRPVPEH
jgi:meso-butanediol dehydrogenase / (S,S)-butanediol dehydrogenase / diacetyl reductase